MAKRPLVIAHRGFSDRYPENTLRAVREAIRAGADMVEVDVQQTRDNQLVVFHDFQLKRLCGIDGRINDIKLADLRRVRPDVPTLSETLKTVRGKCPLLIEMKRVESERVADALQRLDMVDEVIVFSFSIPAMQALADANPRIPRFGLIGEDLEANLARLRSAVKVEGIALGNRLIDSEAVVSRIHHAGWKLFVWTVNRLSRKQQLAHWGVDGLITNCPVP